MNKVLLLSVGTVVASYLAAATPVKIELPVETAVYKPAAGADLANAQCLTCHSVDYATMQPPMPTKFWRATIEKMASKYGAPIPTNQIDALTAYFAHNYGTETNAVASNTVITQILPHDDGKLDGQVIATKFGCLNCHAIDKKIIGPPYKDVAAKYKGKADGPSKVAQQITKGGAGQWGNVPMPPFDMLSPAEVKAVGDWILAQ